MSQNQFVELRCDAPKCDSKIKLPVGDGQMAGMLIVPPEKQEEFDRWGNIGRSDGSRHHYCRTQCGLNLLNALALIVRKRPEPAEPEERTNLAKLREVAGLAPIGEA